MKNLCWTYFSRYIFVLSHVIIIRILPQEFRSVVSKNILTKTVCVFGPGYVGLPLAQDFSGPIRTIGYRRDQKCFPYV